MLSHSQPVKTTAVVHASSPVQGSSPVYQKDEKVQQMDTDEAHGAALTSGADTRCDVNIHSETPKLQAQRPVESYHGGVGGRQSQTSGAHSITKEILLTTRISTVTIPQSMPRLLKTLPWSVSAVPSSSITVHLEVSRGFAL